MKHIKLLFSVSLALLFCQNVTAQTFFKDSSIYYIIKEGITFKYANNCRFKETIRFDSSNQNGEHYSVFVRGLKTCLGDTQDYQLRVKERKVYFSGAVDNDDSAKSDLLIYDFNLNEGDTFEVMINPDHLHFKSKIDSIRLIEYADGITRLTQFHSFFKVVGRFPLRTNWTAFFIEGVGAQSGLVFFPLDLWPHPRHELISVCHKDSLMYIWSDFDDNPNIIPLSEYCNEDSISYLLSYVETKSIINTSKTPISLYPNPSTKSLQIKGIEHGSFEIYNTLGSLIQQGKIDKEIDVSGLPHGLYFISIRNGEAVFTARFIRQ